MLTTMLLAGAVSGVLAPAPMPLASSGEPLTLAEVRQNLRQPPEQDDTLLLDLIVTAREYCEEATGLVLTRRTVTETTPTLGQWVELSSWPVVAVTAIRYPRAGVMTPLGATAWACSYARRPVRLLPLVPGWGVAAGLPWGVGLPVEIDVLAGYATPDDVPMRVKRAMQLLIAHWYANREGVVTGQRAAAIEVPMGVTELLRGLRLVHV